MNSEGTTARTRSNVRACSHCASIKQACDSSLPCGRCARLSLPCHRLDKPTPLSIVKPKVTRVHTGCAICKQRKRKCDEQKPRCGSCVKLCLDCHWSEGWRRQRHSNTVESSPGSGTFTLSATPSTPTDQSPTLSPRWPTTDCSETFNTHQTMSAAQDQGLLMPATPLMKAPSLVPQLGTDQERSLLGHFINITAVCLTRAQSTSTNLYLRYLLPLAFSEQSIMDAILALSASQQEKRGCSDKVTLCYQSKATRRLHHLLASSDSTSSLMALATSLILCMIELYGGSSDAWKQHLRGSKQLIDIVKHGAVRTEEAQFLEDLYRFLDTAATISTCRPPLLADQEHSASHSLPIYGVPRLLFHLLDRVNSLAYQRRTRIDEDGEMAFRQTAQSVIDAVAFHINTCEVTDGEDQIDIAHAASAFKWAIRLRLAQIVDGYDSTNPEVVTAVKNVIHNIEQIPTKSRSEATLLFPLIMAAGACIQLRDREFIRERLVNMKERSGFGHIYSAHELAERVWTYRDLQNCSTSSAVNWAAIRHHEMHGLAIF